jgi:aspartokinase
MGATVLHEDSIFPVRYSKIPINIRNTNRPEDKGTFIVPETDEISDYVITGIAGKKGFSVLTLEKDMMNEEKGFGRRLLQNNKTAYDLCKGDWQGNLKNSKLNINVEVIIRRIGEESYHE